MVKKYRYRSKETKTIDQRVNKCNIEKVQSEQLLQKLKLERQQIFAMTPEEYDLHLKKERLDEAKERINYAITSNEKFIKKSLKEVERIEKLRFVCDACGDNMHMFSQWKKVKGVRICPECGIAYGN